MAALNWTQLDDAEGFWGVVCVYCESVCKYAVHTSPFFGGIEETVVHLLWHKEPNITRRIQRE